MRRIIKDDSSIIVTKKMKYKNPVGSNVAYNRKILAVLEKEQNYFCAYTEERLSAAFARDIEHFNPTLKLKDTDNYRNWFAVSTKFNREKSDKWATYQTIMHPTDENFEKRLWYSDGIYEVKSTDVEADNLRKYLDLNNPILAKERKEYIQSLKDLIELGVNIETHLQKNPITINFPRAIETEFGIKL
jgi:hypothetical protein